MNQLSIFRFLALLAVSSALKLIPPLPQNKLFIEGESMTIKCTAGDRSYYPNITYKRKDKWGVFYPVKPDKRIQITSNMSNDTAEGLFVTRSELNIKAVALKDDNDEGQWHCFYSIPTKTEKSGFTITVIEKNNLPKGVIRGGGTIPYGGTANLTCNVTDGNKMIAPLAGLAWMQGNVILKNGSSAAVLEPLIIKDAATRDGGEYQCVGVASLRNIELRPITLDKTTLYINLRVDQGTTNVTADLYTSAIMDCPAEGYPFNVTWWKINQEGRREQLDGSERFIISRPCRSCRYRLTIKNLQPSDVGQYICQAKRYMESGVHQFKLYLRKLNIDHEVTFVTAAESSNVTMDCPADGNSLNVTWWKMDKEGRRQQLESSERIIIYRPCPSCRYRLIIKNLQPSDVGHYLCQAKLNLWSGMHHFKVSFKNPDEKPTIASSVVAYSAQSSIVLFAGLVAWIMH